MLEIKRLVSGHGQGIVIDGLSLSVAPGEVLGILGHNGSGKTTLLKTLMGLLPVKSGGFALDGRELGGQSAYRIAQAGVGYVPQGREIFADFTVHENLEVAAEPGARLGEAYGLFPALAEVRAKKAGTLSGGQQQQLALARALVRKPKALLLDEPSEGVQPNIAAAIGEVVGIVARESGCAAILVEQNIDLACSACSRIVILRDGNIEAEFAGDSMRSDQAAIVRHMEL